MKNRRFLTLSIIVLFACANNVLGGSPNRQAHILYEKDASGWYSRTGMEKLIPKSHSDVRIEQFDKTKIEKIFREALSKKRIEEFNNHSIVIRFRINTIKGEVAYISFRSVPLSMSAPELTDKEMEKIEKELLKIRHKYHVVDKRETNYFSTFFQKIDMRDLLKY